MIEYKEGVDLSEEKEISYDWISIRHHRIVFCYFKLNDLILLLLLAWT